MKNLKFKSILTVIISTTLISLSSCNSGQKNSGSQDSEGQLKGSISISGAFALYPLVNVWAEEFRKEYPDVKFNISGGGAGKGMADLLGGAVDLAMFSKDINEAEKEKGAYGFAVTKDAVIPTISANNPALKQILEEGIKREEFTNWFLKGGKYTWKNTGKPVNVYTRSDASGAAEVWAKYLGGNAQEELKGIAVFGDPGLAEAVKKDVNGVGYNNVIYVYDLQSGKKYPGVEVAPIDINGNGKVDQEENFYGTIQEITGAIADGRYPSPPARELFLVSKGKPTSPAVTAFIEWVLTKGQAFVEESGYIKLQPENIQKQLERL